MSYAVVVFAPGHRPWDGRVWRSLEVLSSDRASVCVFWDRDRAGGGLTAHSSIDQRLVQWPRYWLIRSLLRVKGSVLGEDVITRVEGANVVYIHDSGIQGLVLARELRKCAPGARIILDYHDYIPFEVEYQLTKRGLGMLYRPISATANLVVRLLAGNLDAIVGISKGQLDHFAKVSGRRLPAAVVPNSHQMEQVQPPPNRSAPEDTKRTALLWVGHVMKGRDLEQIAAWISACNRSVQLNLVGEATHKEVLDHLHRRLGDDGLTHHGGFRSTSELVAKAPSGAIGVFLGWPDHRNTGINRIASPNKYYSYLILGTPVIVHSRLKAMASEVEMHGAGIAVASADDFCAAVNRINDDYDRYRRGMMRLKEKYLSTEPLKNLHELVFDAGYRGRAHGQEG